MGNRTAIRLSGGSDNFGALRVGCGWTCSVRCWIQDIGGVRQLWVRESGCVGGPFVTRPRKRGRSSEIRCCVFLGSLWVGVVDRKLNWYQTIGWV